MRKVRLRVKEIAEAQNLSMTKLHIRSEVAYSIVRKIFRDPYTDITLSTLGRLADALDVEASELIESVPELSREGQNDDRRPEGPMV